jgi:hypothetical protein
MLVLGFACLWFGMLVPVHQRGQVQLPGPAGVDQAAAAAAGAGHCTRTDADAPCRKNHPEPGRDDDDDGARGNCAVCHFIAGLHAPPPITAVEASLGLLGELPPAATPVAPHRHPALPFHGLDPPAA